MLYDTVYGNTETIAESLARGIRTHVSCDCRSIEDFAPAGLADYALVAVGAPTMAFTAPKPMKEFLKAASEVDLTGRQAFAFDTRFAGRLAGSAASYIERRLEEMNATITRPHESATVRRPRDGSQRPGSVELVEGSVDRFGSLGSELGAALAGKVLGAGPHPRP